METVPQRSLTAGERALLMPIFGLTLPYDTQQVARNDDETGGKNNSFTAGYVPNMAKTIWRLDYSSASDDEKWDFIHEMTRVWQTVHDHHNILSGIKIWLTNSDYGGAYFYDLNDSNSFSYYNMEQQASIIPDYWYVSRALPPKYNNGRRTQLNDYRLFISQLLAAGPPSPPMPRIGGNRDYIGHNI